jgi:hypothetical protein
VLYTHRSPAKAVLFLAFLDCIFLLVVLCINRYSCLCVAQVLLEFSLFRG